MIRLFASGHHFKRWFFMTLLAVLVAAAPPARLKGAGAPKPPVTFGTTVITHGFSPTGDGWGTTPMDPNEWMVKMACAIANRTSGRVLIYQPLTGLFSLWTCAGVVSLPGRETVLVFDWRLESNNPAQGFAEAAGDALFAALMNFQVNQGHSLAPLHFIGHSRGTVVNSEAVERLLLAGVPVDQVTNIDPHDWGVPGFFPDDCDANFDPFLKRLPTGWPDCNSTNGSGVVRWLGVQWSDTYFQTTDLLLDGRAVTDTLSRDVSSKPDADSHVEIHDWYLGTITSESDTEGYAFTRVGEAFRDPQVWPATGTPVQRTWHKGAIVNGDFGDGKAVTEQISDIPGWFAQGGGGSAEVSADGIFNLEPRFHLELNALGTSQTHNRFYIPNSATRLYFRLRISDADSGSPPGVDHLEVLLDDTLQYVRCEWDTNPVQKLWLNQTTGSYKWCSIDLTNSRHQVKTLTFTLMQGGPDVNSEVWIDDLDFENSNTLPSSPIALSNPRVSPGAGLTSDSFVFRVDYADAEGVAPTVKSLAIDNGAPISPLQLESGTAARGTYRSNPMSGLSTGQHSFSFHFENGGDAPANTPITSGPYVSTPIGTGGPARLAVLANPNPVSENGCTTLTAVLSNGSGQPMPGKLLGFTTAFPGALHGFPPPGCNGPSYEAGTTGTTDSQGQVKKYFKPSVGGNAVVSVSAAGLASANTSITVTGLPGTVSGSLYVVSVSPGSAYRVEGSLAQGVQPLIQKTVVLTTSSGAFYHNGQNHGTTYTDSTDAEGEFGSGAGNSIELRISNCAADIVLLLDYPAAGYKTAATFSCSTNSVTNQLPLFPVRTLTIPGVIRTLAWTPDGTQLFATPYTGSNSTNQQRLYSWWSSDWSQRFARTDLRHYGLSSTVDPAGTRVVIGEAGGGIELFDLAGNRIVANDQSNDVMGVDWVGSQVAAIVEASGSANDSIKTHGAFWYSPVSDAYSPILTFDPATFYSTDSRLRYSATRGQFSYAMTNKNTGSTQLYLHSASNPASYATKLMFANSTRIEDLDYSSSGDQLAVVGGGFSGVILVNTTSLNTSPIADGTQFRRVAFLKSLNLIAAGASSQSLLKIFDLSGRTVFAATVASGIWSMAWNDAKRLLAVGLNDGTIVIYGFDATSPTIATPTVTPSVYVRGTVFNISADVTDAESGVLDGGVKAVIRDLISGVATEVPLVRGNGNTFSAQWNSAGTTGSFYSVTIRAEDNAGNYSEVSPTGTLSFVSQINAPILSTVTSTSATRMSVAWQDTSPDETGFRIERSTNGLTWVTIATVSSNAQAYSDGGLQPGSWYHYRVTAFNASASANSLPRSAQTRTPALYLNADSSADVFAFQPTTGAWTRHVTQAGGGFASSTGGWSPGWSITPANFNDDGLTDLLLVSPSSGQWFKMLNTGTDFATQASGGWWPGWQRFVMELDGDGVSDVFLYDPTTGQWFKCISTPAGFTYIQGGWNPGWEVTSLQLNDDALGDLFLINRTTGRWFWVLGQNGNGFSYPVSDAWFPGWQLHPGDFNGDGLGDLLLHLPATGQYFVAFNTGSGFSYVQGGWSLGWTPYVGDFDGDGASDLFLHAPSIGLSFEMISDRLGGFTVGGSQWWSVGWNLYPTDFNADGRTDFLLYDPATGVWFQAWNNGAGGFSYFSGNWAAGLTIEVGSRR